MSVTTQQMVAPTLASRPLPRRVRQLLESILEYASAEFERALHATLNDYEAQLFKFAEQARSYQVQTRWLEAQRLVKRTRPDLIPRFMIALEAELAVIRDATVAPRTRLPGQALSLVDDIELDETTVVTEISSRAELRNSLSLYLLGQRFGVLAGKPAMDPETLPIGPQALCRMLRESSKCLELSNEHRLLLFRNFDRYVMAGYGDIVEHVNTLLARNGILPNLQYAPLRIRRAASATPQAVGSRDAKTKPGDGTTAAEPGQDASPPQAPANPSRSGQAAQPFSLNSLKGSFFYTGDSAGGSGASDAGGSASAGGGFAGGAGTAGGGAGGGFPGSAGPGPGGSPAGTGQAGAYSEGGLDYSEEGFQALRRLLEGRKQLLGKLNVERDFESGGKGHAVGTPALQGALDQLQRRKPVPVTVDGKPAHRSVNHIKQDMLALLRMGSPDGSSPHMAEEDSDAVDLIGMLFDNLLKDVKPNSPAARLLSKLQVPLIRVALQDKQFFTQDLHPARQMLNAVAETGVFWINDDEADPTLVEKMNTVVDRTVQDFDGNLDLFRDLLDDIGTHLHTISRKAEVAERRHVEAARGKEKLAVAREHAAQTVEALLKSHNLPRFTHTLLSQAWTDVMALTALRHGEDSPIWKQQTEIAQRLVSAARPGAPAIAREEADELRQEIDSALNQVGYHAEEASAIAARLVDPGSGNEDDAASRTELTMRLKARARLGADMQSGQAQKRELDAEQQARLEQVKQLPFGTWFEFEGDKPGKSLRRRLSWFSTITGHVLFVNQRGQKVAETTLQDLAIGLANGKIRQVATEKGSLIDRAWTSVLGALRSFSGQGVGATP